MGALKDFLADQRKRVRPDMLVLNGDILELAWMSWGDLKEQKLAMDALDELKGFATGIEVSYLAGNHDRYDQIPKDEVHPIHVIAPTVGGPAMLERDGVTYTHGDHWDTTTGVWNALLKLPIRAFLPGLYIKMYGTPYQLRMAQKEQDYHELAFWVNGRAALWAAKQRRSLVFGHTHLPVLMVLPGGLMVACDGDWRDSLSWVEVRDGKIVLKYWG